MPESPEFIWPRLQAAGAKRRLSYDALVRAAAEIADRQGIEAVTMRSVATALNAGAMSLYRYVRGKDDLLDLILDAAFGAAQRHAGDQNVQMPAHAYLRRDRLPGCRPI